MFGDLCVRYVCVYVCIYVSMYIGIMRAYLSTGVFKALEKCA